MKSAELDITGKIKGLKPGKSHLFKGVVPESVRAIASRAGAELKTKFTTRREKDGVRVLRWPNP